MFAVIYVCKLFNYFIICIFIHILGKDLVIFEERVFEDNGDWIYFIKTTGLSEDDLAKQKKQKVKGLNPTEYTSLVIRAWVDYDQLLKAG